MKRSDRILSIINARKEFEERQNRKTEDKEKLINRIRDWVTFYRRNWEIYAIEELGISLKPFQEIILHLIGISDTFFLFCSRGLSKSFMCALAMVCMCLLYPQSEIVITATTMKTAKKFVEKKIENELLKKFSPKLRYLFEHGYITIKYNKEEVEVKFFNGSWIIVLAENPASVGERITGLILEEARQSKLSIVDRVFLPMRHARVPKFRLRSDHKYSDNEYVEKSKTIYLTSVSFRHEPIWRRWVSIVEDYFNSKDDDDNPNNSVTNIYIGDVYTSLYHNFMSVSEYKSAKKTSSDLEFRMEYLNESPIEGDGSYYDYKMFYNNSILSHCFYPPTYEEWLYEYERGTMPYFRPKKDSEIRAIYVDFAFNDSVKAENDLTVIGCMSGYLNDDGDKYLRNVEYLTSLSGGDRDKSILTIRELFFFYEADYLILDVRNGGIDRFIELSKPYEHEELGLQMKGFSLLRDRGITDYFYTNEKLEKVRERVVDKQGMECTILVAGTDERNDYFHRQMKNALLNSSIRFLKNSSDIKKEWEENDILNSLTIEDMSRKIMPYIQCELLVQEAIQLEKKLIRGGFMKLYEVGNNTKDKIVATEYANYLFYLLEMRECKKRLEGQKFDYSKMKLVF